MAFVALAGVGIANLAFVWRMTSGIGDLRERMARLEERMGRMEERMGRMDERMARVEGLIEGLGISRRPDPAGLPATGG